MWQRQELISLKLLALFIVRENRNNCGANLIDAQASVTRSGWGAEVVAMGSSD